jgi:RHS repeat-associated protein
MNVQYVHWDHLGSTRMVTDEHGISIASFKYYPFGYEAEFAGGSELRQRFTGHERDDGVGLDYMMARSCRMSLGRFLEPDPYDESMRPALPQSWNRYSYVLNNPISATDPEGYVEDNGLDSINDYDSSVTTDPGTPAQRPTQPDNSPHDVILSPMMKEAGLAMAYGSYVGLSFQLFGGMESGASEGVSTDASFGIGAYSVTVSPDGQASVNVSKGETSIDLTGQSVSHDFTAPVIPGVKAGVTVSTNKVELVVKGGGKLGPAKAEVAVRADPDKSVRGMISRGRSAAGDAIHKATQYVKDMVLHITDWVTFGSND